MSHAKMFWWLFSFLLYPLYYCVISHRQSNFIIGGHASIEQSQAARYKRQPATGDDNEQHLEMNRQLRLPFPEKIFSIPAGFNTGEALQQRWFINQLVIQPPLPARRIFSLSQSNLTTQLASCRKKNYLRIDKYMEPKVGRRLRLNTGTGLRRRREAPD